MKKVNYQGRPNLNGNDNGVEVQRQIDPRQRSTLMSVSRMGWIVACQVFPTPVCLIACDDGLVKEALLPCAVPSIRTRILGPCSGHMPGDGVLMFAPGFCITKVILLHKNAETEY